MGKHFFLFFLFVAARSTYSCSQIESLDSLYLEAPEEEKVRASPLQYLYIFFPLMLNFCLLFSVWLAEKKNREAWGSGEVDVNHVAVAV